MVKKTLVGFLGVTLWLSSCQHPKHKMAGEVKRQDQEVQKGFSKDKADQLIGSYHHFIEKYPEDTTSRTYMVKGAEVCILNNDPEGALQFINRFLQKYPNDAQAPMMQFKKAMVYDLLVHDRLRAIAEYDILVKKYPEGPLSKEAEMAILLLQDPGAYLDHVIKKQDSGAVGTSPGL